MPCIGWELRVVFKAPRPCWCSSQCSSPTCTIKPIIYFGVAGEEHRQRQGYLLYQGLSPYKADETSLKIGYLNRFDRYLSTVTVNYLNSSYYYTKSGTKPASISLPFSLTVNLTNTTFKNYSYSVNGEFIYRSSSYENRDLISTPHKFVSWVVHAESGKKIVGDLPAELRVKFPAIQTDKLVHLSSSYITKGHTYSDYINFNLNRTSQDDPFEEAGVRVK
jgi:hypothetical protein